MFFWKFITVTIKYYLKTSLQASRNQIYPNIKGLPLNPKMKISKRTFSFSPSELKASICIEAALSFSFFLFFFVNILSIILAFVFYTEDVTSLQQQGKKAAVYAYVTADLWKQNEDLIVLRKHRKIQSLFSILPVENYRLMAKCVVKPWVGYDVTKEKIREEEIPLVYITEYGTVFHRERSCAHLSLSVQVSSIDSVTREKNESGEYYRSCIYCGKNSFVSAVYITSYGNKYHTSINCRGLKRSVKSIPLSEVGDRGVCKKCG